LSRLADGMGGTSPWYMSGNVRIPSNANRLFGLRIPTLYECITVDTCIHLHEDHGGHQETPKRHQDHWELFRKKPKRNKENTTRKWPHHFVFALSKK
jgi:hypothetical protein